MAAEDRPVTLRYASRKFQIPIATLHNWLKAGILRVVKEPEQWRKGQPIFIDPASVIAASKTYTPHSRGSPPNAGAEAQQTTLAPLEKGCETSRPPQHYFTQPSQAFQDTERSLNGENLDTKALFDAFQDYNSILAPATRVRYDVYLTSFVEQHPTLPLDSNVISRWIVSGEVSEAYKFNRYRDLKTFYRFLERQKELFDNLGIRNPIYKVRAPRKPRTLPRYLSDDELQAVVDYPPDFQDKVMLEVFATTGIRDGELCLLKVKDIYPDHLRISSMAKTGARDVDVIPQVYERLQTLIQGRESEDFVFLNDYGKPLTPSACTHRVMRIMRAAGIKGDKIGPHTLRHTFGYIQQRDGGDMRALQIMLGHSKIGTTEIYSHLARGDVSKKFYEAGPHKILRQFREGGEGDGVS